jgi:hypothetical protein
LALAGAAELVAGAAIIPDLCDMSGNSFPAFNLPPIIFVPTTDIVAAIPLEPPARIVGDVSTPWPATRPRADWRLFRIDSILYAVFHLAIVLLFQTTQPGILLVYRYNTSHQILRAQAFPSG